MAKKKKKTGNRHGLQAVTLCISTAMVLILLGLVVFSVFTARNLSEYVRQNIVVTMVLQDDMTSGEAQQFCARLRTRPYIHKLTYVSKEEALREGIRTLGTDPREFADTNPFLSSVEVTLKSDYANSDSLVYISRELKNYPKVSEVKYEKDLVDSVNANIAKISVVLLSIALLLTIVSFAHQQHRASEHLCPPLLHSYDEARRRVMGIHPCSFRAPLYAAGLACRHHSVLRPRRSHLRPLRV